jgi:transcriptional regulator with XRE-family HTH domain
MEVLRMTTGEKIRYFRTSHELTQEQLASQSGLSISALQKYESDERKPKPEQLLKISDALGISINIFMDFDIRTVSDLFSLLFRMEEQANLRFYKDTTTDTVGIYFENEYITEKISSYAEMLREIDNMNPSHQELMHTKIQNELLNDNTSIQEVSVTTSSSHKDAASSLAVEEKLLDIISDCTPAEQEQILDALTFLKNWMRTAKEK